VVARTSAGCYAKANRFRPGNIPDSLEKRPLTIRERIAARRRESRRANDPG